MKPAVIYFFLALVYLFAANRLTAQRPLTERQWQDHQKQKQRSLLKKTVTWSLDTVFLKGQPYAIVREKKRLPYNDYSVYGLDNTLLISVSTVGPSGDVYLFRFEQPRKSVRVYKDPRRRIHQMLVQHQLIQGNAIDPYHHMLFVMKQSLDRPKTVNVFRRDEAYSPVSRNTDGPVYARDGIVLQDYHQIGSYKINASSLRVYLPNNLVVAEMDQHALPTGEYRVKILSDRTTRNLQLKKGQELDDLVHYLCRQGIL